MDEFKDIVFKAFECGGLSWEEADRLNVLYQKATNGNCDRCGVSFESEGGDAFCWGCLKMQEDLLSMMRERVAVLRSTIHEMR